MPRPQSIGPAAIGGPASSKTILKNRRTIAFGEIGKIRTIATLAGGPNARLSKDLVQDARRMVNIDYKSGTSDLRKLADALKPEIAAAKGKQKAALKAEQTFYATVHKGLMKTCGNGAPTGDIFNQSAIASSLTTLTQSSGEDLIFATYIADAVKDGAPKIAGNTKIQSAIVTAKQAEESTPDRPDKALLQPQEPPKEQSQFGQGQAGSK